MSGEVVALPLRVTMPLEVVAELLAEAQEAGAAAARASMTTATDTERMENLLTMELTHGQRVRHYESRLRLYAQGKVQMP